MSNNSQNSTNAEKLSEKVKKLVDEISTLSVSELSDLVKALQDKFGVAPVQPVATTQLGAQPSTQTTPPEGSTAGGGATQTVIMTNAGENKIAVIKVLREINQNLGLKEAKDATENVPFEVLKDAKAEDAKAAAEKLKAAGATVEIK